MACQNQGTQTQTTCPQRNNYGYIIIIVLYILLAIILGSVIA